MPRILGIDHGDKRIGVAVSDGMELTAQPLLVIAYDHINTVIDKIKDIVEEYEVIHIVVGLPRNMNGEETPRTKKVIKFIDYVKKHIDIPIDTWDERLTTKIAEEFLISADVKRNRRKEVIDKMAAQVILQGYLDHKRLNPI